MLPPLVNCDPGDETVEGHEVKRVKKRKPLIVFTDPVSGQRRLYGTLPRRATDEGVEKALDDARGFLRRSYHGVQGQEVANSVRVER